MAVEHDANKDIVRGQLFLFIGELPIAFASSAALEITTEEIDVSNKMMGDWSASLPGKKSFTLSSESLLTRKEGQMSFDTLLDKQIAGDTLDFVFGEATVANKSNTGGEFTLDATKKNYKGTVMITSLSLKSDNGAIASCSVSFKGVGALTPVAGSGGGDDIL
ncbi:phage tail protein [Parabacteroides pacaensis]|uniref:hypothetical protein n=1 Tax=Parabacteroides pacaensis TaxID=2086575 RepID=UPI000D11458E|nr:hypothetical protein [Parabacteroides pacaensis]